jgi:glyoxylase-like metal-dependent hydrolase (beta-lactamase superfamily II)
MSAISRRFFAAGLAAAPVTALLPKATLAAARGPLAAPIPLARIQIGRFEVTFLSDGFIDFPYEFFTGASPEQVRAAAAAYFADGPKGVRAGFTVWLINDGERLGLVDSGPAGTVSKSSGRLLAALAAIGVTPDQIDAVIATHLHVDHIAGLVAGDRAQFPNAEVYADRRDVAFFTDPAKAAAAPDLLRSSFATAEKLVKLYPKLQRIDGERELSHGISIVDLAGHTPGQIGVRVADAGQSLLLAADMLFHPAAHPAMPGLGILFELDKPAADASRGRFFARMAEERALVAATHMPFPGLGHVAKDGDRLRWVPADWTYAG